jgi:hypothetical protein
VRGQIQQTPLDEWVSLRGKETAMLSLLLKNSLSITPTPGRNKKRPIPACAESYLILS